MFKTEFNSSSDHPKNHQALLLESQQTHKPLLKVVQNKNKHTSPDQIKNTTQTSLQNTLTYIYADTVCLQRDVPTVYVSCDRGTGDCEEKTSRPGEAAWECCPSVYSAVFLPRSTGTHSHFPLGSASQAGTTALNTSHMLLLGGDRGLTENRG